MGRMIKVSATSESQRSIFKLNNIWRFKMELHHANELVEALGGEEML